MPTPPPSLPRIASADSTVQVGRPQPRATFLDQRDVVGIGSDTCSIDRLVATGFPVHRLWLGAGKWALENVANLEQVPAAGAYVVVGVPRIAGCTGFPARVIAFF